MKITNGQSLGERMNWEHGEHSGTITFPGEERGPVDIQWDNDPPDNYEEIEALVEAAASIEQITNNRALNNPWCEACKEPDCCVSGDGTCAMIRKYLSSP